MELLVVSRQQLPSSCVSSFAAPFVVPAISQQSESSCVSSVAARSIGPASPKSVLNQFCCLRVCLLLLRGPLARLLPNQFLSQFRHLHLPHFRRRAQAFFHNLPACSSRSPIGSVVFWPCLPINRNLLLFYTSSLSIFEEMSSVNSRPLCTKRVQFPLSNDAMFFCGPLVQGRSGRLWQCACSCRADLVRSGLFRQRACFMQLRHDHFGVDLSISTPSTGCII